MKKRMLSLALALMLALGLLPSAALAADAAPAALMDAIAATLTESSDGWTVLDMARYRAVEGKTSETSADARQNALNLLIAEAAGADATASDRARLEIILKSMGVDSTRLYPANSVTPINNAEKLAGMDLTKDGYYAAPWILLSDLQGAVKLPEATQNALIALLKTHMGDGLFGYEYNGVTYADPDTAGMALAALARFYTTNTDAKEVVDKVLEALPKALDANGSLGSANSDAVVIIGIIALGKNPAVYTSPTGASVVDGLLSYVNSTRNGFLFAGEPNTLATEQGFRALVALAAFDGQTPYNIYDFSAVSAEPGRATGSGVVPAPPTPSEDSGDIAVTVAIQAKDGVWLSAKPVTVKEGSTAYHAFTEALKDTGIAQAGAEKGYVKSITKDGVTLAEFTHGQNSGWLYKVNGVAPDVAITQYKLAAGDAVLWYYTGDWVQEPDMPGGSSPSGAEPPLPFTDVTEEAWFCEAVRYVYEEGLMEGAGETVFAPHMPLSRAMLATAVWRMAGSPEAEAAAPFPDVPQTAWYAQAVAWAAENAVVLGRGDGTFGPDSPITREELAAVLYRCAGAPAVKGALDGFADGGKASAWAVDALLWAVENGVVNGKEDGALDPQGQATRAEAAALLQRYITLG